MLQLCFIPGDRVTQNKVHHLLAISYLTFEVNITQVSYVIKCVIVNGVQFTEVQYLKGFFERNISNCAVIWQTTQFEISFKNFQLKFFSYIEKMSKQF